MFASITIPSDVPGMIALCKKIGALPANFSPPEGIALAALVAWLLILLYMFLRLRRG